MSDGVFQRGQRYRLTAPVAVNSIVVRGVLKINTPGPATNPFSMVATGIPALGYAIDLALLDCARLLRRKCGSTSLANGFLLAATLAGSNGGSLYGVALGTTPMNDQSIPYSWWVAGGSTRSLQKGDLILTEITGTYYGYPGQLIRSIVLGDPPPEVRKIGKNLALELYREVQAVVKVGNTPA